MWHEKYPREVVQQLADVTEYDDDTELLDYMVPAYCRRWRELPWEVLGTELSLSATIPGTEHNLAGTIDTLVRINDKLWAVDHKTAGRFRDEANLEFDDQMLAYTWLLDQIYTEPVGGVVYSQIRKKLPQEPRLIKSGKRLSKRAIDTTREMFEQAIEKHGFDEADYQDILMSLDGNDFMRTTRLPVSQSRLEIFERRLQYEATEMARAHTEHELGVPWDQAFYPHLTRDCQRFCSYWSLCTILEDGGDVECLIDALYYIDNDEEEVE